MNFNITGVNGESMPIDIPRWMASMKEPISIGVVKKLMETQYGVPFDAISLMDSKGSSGDPMDDSEAVVAGMDLVSIIEPTAFGVKPVGTAATFKGTFSSTTQVPLKGVLTVEDDDGNLRAFSIARFGDVTSRYEDRDGVQVFGVVAIESIRWERTTDTGSKEVTVFVPVDQRSAAKLLGYMVMDSATGELKPHRHPSIETLNAQTDLMVSGYLRKNAGTSQEVVIPVASDKNEGVCVTDGTLVCGFKNVQSDVTEEGKVTWIATAHGVAMSGFERLTDAAIMADIVSFFTDPFPPSLLRYPSAKGEFGNDGDFNIARPTPSELAKWQEVLHQPNVEKFFVTITKVPVTKGDMKRLDFVLRMLISLAVHTLVTAVGEGSPVSVHNELFERVNALSKLVPSGAGDDECPRGLSEVVSMWKLFFETYTQAAGGADSPVSLVPINHPREVDNCAQGDSVLVLMKLGSSFYAARVSFANTRNDGCLAVSFPWGSYVDLEHVHPAINPVFMFGETSKEPACKKQRCE